MALRHKMLTGGTIPVAPSMGAQLVNRPATKHAAHQAFATQDLVIGSGRRVLLEAGLRGGGRFVCRNGVAFNSESAGAAIAYADGYTYRVVCRASARDVTPGSAIRLRVVAEPSGMHHGDVTGDSTVANGGAGGWVRLTATWDNGTDTRAEVGEIFIPGSNETNNGEPSADGASWLLTTTKDVRLQPHGWKFDQITPTTAEWCIPGTTVDLLVEYRGSPRVWDLIVYEDPRKIATDDNEAGDWHWGGYAHGSYPFQHPRASADDSTDGTRGQQQLVRTLQGIRGLGPSIIHWHSGAEHIAEIETWVDYSHGGTPLGTTGDDEAPPVTVTGTTFDLLWEAAIGAHAATNPGPGVGCAAYARHVHLNGDRGAFGLRGRGGVLPVWVAVRWKVSAGTGTVRVQTRPHSWIDVTTTSTSYTWTTRPGYLSVGRGPEDNLFASIMAKCTGVATVSVRDVIVYPRAP